MLAVGIDWAEEFHLVALGRAGEGVFEVLRVEHRPDAVAGLVGRIARLEPDPAEVRVVLETRHGMLVDALVDAGYTVLPVNPELVSRRRGPARKKDDAEDARICCRLALDRHAGLNQLIPHGRLAGELRSIARDDERACRDERRLLNRLRADLIATFPAALEIAGDDLGAPRMLRLLQKWPTAAALAAVSRDELIDWARAAHSGYLQRFADGCRPRWPATSSPPRRTSCGPRPTRSDSPPDSCCSSTPSGGPGRNGWATCSSPALTAQPRPGWEMTSRGRRFLAARST